MRRARPAPSWRAMKNRPISRARDILYHPLFFFLCNLQMVYMDVAAPLHHSTSFSFSLYLFLSFSLSLFLSFSLLFSLFLSFFLPSFLPCFLSFFLSLSLSLPSPLFLYDSIYKDADGQARALSVGSRNGSVFLCV